MLGNGWTEARLPKQAPFAQLEACICITLAKRVRKWLVGRVLLRTNSSQQSEQRGQGHYYLKKVG